MSEEKTYSQMRKEFYNSFETKIVPMLQPYEAERKRTRIIASIVSAIFGVLGIMIFILLFLEDYKLINDGFSIVLMFGILAWISWYCFKKHFENKIKKKIMPIVCACFGNMKWFVGSYTSGHIFKDSCVISVYDSAKYDDIFLGLYKDVNFEIIEGKFTIKKGKSRKTIFSGVIVKLDMNKNFNSHTVIKPDSVLHVSPSKNLKHTTLEDVQFEKKYDVFTNDPVDARYLITPSFMVRLNNMKTAFEANKISCAFYHDKLIIALPTNKDLFSICSLVKPIDDAKQYYIMYEEIVSIIKLIDYFKFNQKIGM